MTSRLSVVFLTAVFISVVLGGPVMGAERATGVGLKLALLPPERFGIDEAFGYLRLKDPLGIEGLITMLEGGVRSDLQAISLDIKLLLIGFQLEEGVLYPFTGLGTTLELAPRTRLIPEGLGGLVWLRPPLLFLGELRIQSLRGMTAILGFGFEF